MELNDKNADMVRGGHARRPYQTPRLVSHGTLEEITQTIGKNSGAGDADAQSGGAG
jgi:hypothetical protein